MSTLNAFSVDVEDWFCAQNVTKKFGTDSWERLEPRIEGNLEVILGMLADHDIKATFFILGWIAEKYPELVKRIDAQGHEIATHGFTHTPVTSMTPEEFTMDLERSLKAIRTSTNQEIIGFRAPSFSINDRTRWAFEILKEHGIKYDSSVFPVGFHPDYGLKDSPLRPHEVSEGLTEFPMSCMRFLGRNIPIAGGAYFRLYPYWFTKICVNKINKENRSIIFYVHPWEIDLKQPRHDLGFLKNIRHYKNLHKTEQRLTKLFNDFKFSTIRKVLDL